MTRHEEPVIARLARAVADGDTVDWDAERSKASSPEVEMLRQLHLLGALHVADERRETTGRRWGVFEIRERLGGGGFGEVFRAQDPSLQRDIALKLWLPGGADLDEQLLEARTLARVRHPNVLVVHGVDVHDGQVGMWTEILEGTTLEEWLSVQGPLAASEVMRIGVDLARALNAVHAEGLIHGDVKPSNVIRENGGRIVLLDFGTVMPPPGASDPSPRPVVGTPVAMPPERLRGEPPTVRTDVYGLGALLYRLATGKHPIDAANLAELREKSARGELVPLRERRADLPPDFVAIVETSLAPDPSRRFESMRAMERALSAGLRASAPSVSRTDAAEPETMGVEAIPHHLPRPLTGFIGRDIEISTCVNSMRHAGLLTLTGPGGTGKTRLAIEVARRLLPEFADGVWWVELAQAKSPEGVVRELARVLQLREVGKSSLEQQVIVRLADASLLLVLDNCEHVREACRALVDRLLAAAKEVRVLATSRELLGIRGERVFLVPPLSLPPDSPSMRLEAVRETESVQLFEERARLADRAFQVTELNVVEVAGICRRLDGLPLAVELAAARIGMLAPREIHRRLDQALRLLQAQGPMPERHRTLEAAIAWSFDLLEDNEKPVFCALSVFAGSFALDAVADVVAPGEDELATLDLLAHLCDRSLLAAHRLDAAHTGYRMLESIRAFAASRLNEERRVMLRSRHLDYFMRRAEAADALHATGSVEGFEDLDRHQADIAIALDADPADSENAERGLRLVASLPRYWSARGQLSVGRRAIARHLERGRTLPSEPRVKALVGAGQLAYLQSDLGEARIRFEQACQEAAELGTPLHRARALTGLGMVEMDEERHDAARQFFELSLDLQLRETPGPGVATALNNLGAAAWRAGDWAGASRALEDAVSRADAAGVSDVAVMALTNLALIDLCGPDSRHATERLERAIDEALRRKVYGLAPSLLDLAGVATARSRPEQSLGFFGASRAIRSRMGRPGDRLWQATLEPHYRSARDAVSPLRGMECEEQGGRLEIDSALGTALEALRRGAAS